MKVLEKIKRCHYTHFHVLFLECRGNSSLKRLGMIQDHLRNICITINEQYLSMIMHIISGLFCVVEFYYDALRDVLPPNLVKSRRREIGYWNDRIVLEFYRHFGSAATEVLAKFQSDCRILRHRDFTRSCSKTSVRLVNRGLEFLRWALAYLLHCFSDNEVHWMNMGEQITIMCCDIWYEWNSWMQTNQYAAWFVKISCL